MQAKNVTYQAEGLYGRPGVGMKLSRSHFERLKDAHCEVIER